MIVDVHTHVWQTPDQLGRADLGDPTAESARQAGGGGRTVLRRIPLADTERHWQAGRPADRVIVQGFRSRLMRADVPNDFVADYVRRHPEKLIGFAGVDPCDDRAHDELARAIDDLHLDGVVVSPASQGFHPSDSKAMRLYELVERRGVPIVFHTGGGLSENGRLEFARPVLLDEVARAFPSLRVLVTQLGHPFVAETCALLAKHPHLYADVGGVAQRPWQSYNALLCAYEHGVIGKLLFGSDFPYYTAGDTIEALFSLNVIAQGTNLPTIPRSALRGIIERDALALLGLHP